MTKLEAWFRRNFSLWFVADDHENVDKLKLGDIYRPDDHKDIEFIYIGKNRMWIRKKRIKK